jgi:catechol 2,3-dioxygenase-like lactoylglutathione lyase family enzyme
MSRHIGGIQQVGIGTTNLQRDWKWYRKHFGMDIRVFEDAAEAPLMTQYTGGEVRKRIAVLALNMEGGGGFEIWQYVSREPTSPKSPLSLRDMGILAVKMKARDVAKAAESLGRMGVSKITALSGEAEGGRHFFVSDPVGNWFEIIEGQEFFNSTGRPTGGVFGVLIGVSDMDRSVRFYRDLLDFDVVVSDQEDVFEDFQGLRGSNEQYRRVILEKSKMPIGPFSPLLGTNQIELIQPLEGTGHHVFQDRFWGDPGFIHLCFDVQDMTGLKEKAAKLGYPFTVDSADSFDMGKAAGRFGYVEDPDGTLIEFVETHRLPIVEKWGWHINLAKRDYREKSLPRWLLNCFRFNRVKR